MTINISTKKLFHILQMALLLSIFGLLLWSQPWDTDSSSTNKRTITVNGEATIEATPDKFTFNPYFQASGTDPEALRDDLTTLANNAVEELKKLGVEEKDIKLDASAYDRWYYQEDEEGTLTVSLQIEVPQGDVVQSVQDYLLTLDVKGQISPRATFSKDKQKELDAKAVEEASNDAKSKAEAQAKIFDAKVGKVVSVNQGRDSIFYGGIEPAIALDSSVAESTSLPVLPGENDYTQTVTVVYELK